MTSSVFDVYLEFTCADAATQSVLWDKSIEALQKNPRTKFASKQKPVYAQTMSIEQIRERSRKTGDFISQEEEDIVELLNIIDSRIPGTFEPGDRVRIQVPNGVEGVVIEDYRKGGGTSVEIIFDGHRDSFPCTPDTILSTEVGK